MRTMDATCPQGNDLIKSSRTLHAWEPYLQVLDSAPVPSVPAATGHKHEVHSMHACDPRAGRRTCAPACAAS